MRKKGQAAGAATLVGIIAALIVLYILIIPAEEREKILEGEDSDGSSSSKDNKNLTLFELENPKKFMPLDTNEFTQLIPNINIVVWEEGTELKRVDSLYVSKSLFGENTATTNFELINLEDAENLLLNFKTEKGQGRLKITLNSEEIFNKEITSVNIDPIQLKEGIKQGTNTLVFSVSSPGASFWRTNEYNIEELTVTANMLRRESEESRNTFVLASSEKENMEKVRFKFVPACNIKEVGKLDIWINNYNLYSAIPDCGYLTAIDFSPNYLVTGENILKFSTERGRYLLEQIKITSELKEVELPVYYFQLTKDEYKYVKNESKNVTLYMKFADDTELKEADITVNGNLIRLSQDEREFKKNINRYVEEGNNAVKVEPLEPMDVAEFKITLVD